MPFLRTAPIRIQPYFGYRNHDRLIVTARAMHMREPAFARRGRWQAIRTMLAQFVSHEVPDLPVELELVAPDGARFRHQGLTDREGFVSFDIRLDGAWPYAEHPEWETVTFHWANRDGAQAVDGYILAPGQDTGLAIISDIDDTIIETGITGSFRAVMRNWRRIVMEMPADRILVPGADVFYNALGGAELLAPDQGHAGEHQRAPHRPFFYVSSSPWNLYSYLVTYMRGRGLPLGPMHLRDWGMNRDTFGSGSHGDHKRSAIEAIMALYPDMKFALIGDDSQGDLPAFAAIANALPGRVRAVFIRKLGETMNAAELAAVETLKAANVPLWQGEGYQQGRQFLASIGLLDDGEAEAIVASIEPARPASQ